MLALRLFAWLSCVRLLVSVRFCSSFIAVLCVCLRLCLVSVSVFVSVSVCVCVLCMFRLCLCLCMWFILPLIVSVARLLHLDLCYASSCFILHDSVFALHCSFIWCCPCFVLHVAFFVLRSCVLVAPLSDVSSSCAQLPWSSYCY